MPAPFIWFDVTAQNTDEVGDFYASMFGWTIGAAPEPYQGWMMDADQPWGGVVAVDAAVPGQWLPYVLVDDGEGEHFAPAGRTFRQWVALPRPDRDLWEALLREARAFVAEQTGR